MCLSTYQILPRRATKDIVCYKVLHFYNAFKVQQFITPYTHTILHNKTLIPDYFEKTPHYIMHSKRKIVMHGIHVFFLPIHVISGGIKVKCIIPKGSLYYISDSHREICAEKVIMQKIISTGYYFFGTKIHKLFEDLPE